MKKIYSLLLTLMLAFCFNAFIAEAQYNPTNLAPYNNPNYLVNNILLGGGVTATNITFQGKPIQLGYFSGGNTGSVKMGIDSGIVLSTGDITKLAAPQATGVSSTMQIVNNIPWCGDIFKMMKDSIKTVNGTFPSNVNAANDAAILEFDFIPIGDTVKFDYVFGSEEYPEFVCSYNDGVAIFLSGPGINGSYSNNAKNIALVPYTNPPVAVSIYNVNKITNGNCAWKNSNDSLYVDNTGGTDFAVDGFTKVFTASSPVQCGLTYHIIFAIADANDKILDSGLFLKASALVTNQVTFNTTSSSGIVGDSSLVEGCSSGYLTFNRPGNLDSTFVVHLTYNDPLPYGTKATMGVDFSSLPDSIIFKPHVPQIKIPITAFQDNITEGFEGIAITMKLQKGACGGAASFTRYMYIVNPLPVKVTVKDINICPGDSAKLVASIKDGYSPFTYQWYSANASDTLKTYTYLPKNFIEKKWVMVKSLCNGTIASDTATITQVPSNPLSISFVNGATSITENCGDSILVKFELDSPSTIALGSNLTFTGSATKGLDFIMNDTIIFAVGDSVKFLWFRVLSDKITDPNESAIITANSKNICSGFVNTITIKIVEFDSAKVTLSNPSPVCSGIVADYLAIATGTNKTKFIYSWSGGNLSKTNIASYSFLQYDSIIVIVTDTVCKKAYNQAATINISIAPKLSINTITATPDTVGCDGNNVSLIVSPIGFSPFKYSWIGTSNKTNTLIAFVDSTTTFSVNVKDRCNTNNGITKSKIVYALDCTGIDEVGDVENIALYPNPTQGIFKLSNLATKNNSITISNLLGETVQKETTKGASNVELNVSNLPSGLYFISVGERSYKFIKN